MFWFEFIVCASLLAYFAYNLCKEGLILSEKTNIDKGIIGMFFLAIATSFPEIVTASTAVYSLGRIGLGYGDIVGSVIVNLMILVALDYSYGKGRMLLKVSSITRLSGVFVLIISFILLISAVLRFSGIVLPAVKWVGFESVLIVAVYFIYLKVLRRSSLNNSEHIYNSVKDPFWKIWLKFILLLIVVILLGVWLAKVGEKIVANTSLTQTFTGTLLLGFVTSLPEIIVSFAALKAGSVDMAVGNIIGSNLFDVSIIPFLDLLSKRGPILGMLTSGQILATSFVLILSALVLIGFFFKRDSRLRLSWDTTLIFVVGFVCFVILYYVK